MSLLQKAQAHWNRGDIRFLRSLRPGLEKGKNNIALQYYFFLIKAFRIIRILYFLLRQWVSYLVLLAEEPCGIIYDWQLAGRPSGGSEYKFLEFLQHLSVCVYYCSTYYKSCSRVGGKGGGHVLRETTSRGLWAP